MRILTLSAILLILSYNAAISQFNGGVPWSIQVDKKFDGEEVLANVEYKNATGGVIHTDEFIGEIDENGFVSFVVGNPDKEPLPPELYKEVRKFCWKITFLDQLGEPMITGMQNVTAVPVANVSGIALNSERLQGSILVPTGMTISDFLMVPEDVRELLVHTSGIGFPSSIRKVNISDFIKCSKALAALTGQEIDVLQIGGGEDGKPIVFNSALPPEIADYFAVYAVVSAFRHVFAVRAKKHLVHDPESINHNTAAIYADNTENELSAGVLAAAQTWGLYGSGQNGAVGITNGLGNGAGTTGFVANAPDTGGFKYGLYANANSIINAWAAALFGNSFYTGTLTMSSDARLKTAIRGQTNALDKVLKLKPSQYTYRQDTPYSLPGGLHYGFLAQEVEEVLPELVSDVTMPLSLDPQEMYRSGTTEYKGINYIEMISILTSAMQEMHAKMEVQSKEIAQLQEALKNK